MSPSSVNVDATETAEISRAQLLLIIPFFLALAFTVYSPVLQGQFVWDDLTLIVENESAHSLSKAASQVFKPFWNDDLKVDTLGYFRPVISLSYAVDWAISQGNAAWFHVVNVLVHTLNALLICLLLLTRGRGLLQSLSISSLFLVSARAVEDIAWISGRTDVFATLFVLLAFFAVERNRWWLAAVLCGLALGSKEVSIGAVLAVAFLAFTATKRNVSALLWLAGVCAAYFSLRIVSGTQSVGVQLSLSDRVLSVGHSVANGEWGLITPMLFKIDYPPLLTQSWPIALAGLGLALLLLILVVTVLRKSRTDALRVYFTLCGAAAFMLPTHILVLPYDLTGADRFLYLPFASLLLVMGSFKVPKVVAALCAALAVPSGMAAHRYAGDWRTSLQLWTSSVARSEGSQTLSGNLADTLSELSRCDEAIAWYSRAEAQAMETAKRLHLNSGDLARAKSMHGRAKCLEQLGRHAESIALLTEVIRLRPEWKRPKFNLVLAYVRARDFESAQRELTQLTAQFPDDARLSSLQSGISTAVKDRQRIHELPGDAVLDAELTYSLEQGEVSEALQLSRKILSEPAVVAQRDLRLKAIATLVDKGPLVEAKAAAESPDAKSAGADINDALLNRVAERFADTLKP